ncbi:MAG: phosphoglycerate kinase [Hyphomicrobiales bacterium]|nr:phosphoglycerate kinase [Hyphomicrobiales bacterium]MDE2115698.1 phosphoglycerate kinase [Hyphomicrobiales bacterium]
MNTFKTLDQADLSGKRVLTRVDLNVPMENGKVTDATRIDRILPTLREISKKGGKVILLAHFGRPKGGPDAANSLAPVAAALAAHLGQNVAFASDCIGAPAAEAVAKMHNGDVLLLENTRFHKGEEKNDPQFVQDLARNGDIYVNDAFSAAHRAHASTEGLAHVLPAFAGRTMQAELEALGKALEHPQKPVAAIVGGAKVSSKLDLLGNLVKRVDMLIIGGGMANTFLAAQGKPVGKSLCEHDLLDTARDILAKAKAANCAIILPVDGVMAKEFKANPAHRTASVDDIAADEMMLDIGAKSVAMVADQLKIAKTLVWNGPFGAFEMAPFDQGTNGVAQAAAKLTKAGKLLTVAGGGDTVSALNHAGVGEDFTYISTAGGAFLEWLEGKPLPGVDALRS